MQVSIIIVTYNTLQMTKECIDSVVDKTKDVEYEIILVDNASSDGSKEFFEKDIRIKYVYSEENLGFGRANNLGFQYSAGKYIFLLNSDTLLINNAIYDFWKYMEEKADANLACLGCQLVNADLRPIHSSGAFPGVKQFADRILNFTFWELYRVFKKEEKSILHDIDVDYITGADLFIRRTVIEQCGMFDPDFFMYFEETEMQYRFAKAGYKRRIITDPQIIHLVGASYKKKNHSLKGVIREMKSRYIYCQKTKSTLTGKLIAVMHLLMVPRVLLSRAPLCERKELINLILKNII